MGSVPVEKQGKVFFRNQMHGSAVRPGFYHAPGIRSAAAKGKGMEGMGQILRLEPTGVFYHRQRV